MITYIIYFLNLKGHLSNIGKSAQSFIDIRNSRILNNGKVKCLFCKFRKVQIFMCLMCLKSMKNNCVFVNHFSAYTTHVKGRSTRIIFFHSIDSREHLDATHVIQYYRPDLSVWANVPSGSSARPFVWFLYVHPI